MRRRDLFGKLAAITAAAALAPAAKGEAAPERCSDCAMIVDQMPVPEAFAPAPADSPYMDMVRRSVHEMAVREQISHSEAGIRVYWQAFPSYTTESDAIADARAEGYNRGHDVGSSLHESRGMRASPVRQDVGFYIRGAEGFRGVEWLPE